MALREGEFGEVLRDVTDAGERERCNDGQARLPGRDRPARVFVWHGQQWLARQPLLARRRTLPRQLVADVALLLVTVIWGGTFVMVKDAVAAYPVFSFLALRFTFAALALAPLAWWRSRGGGPGQGRAAGGAGEPADAEAQPRTLAALWRARTRRLAPAPQPFLLIAPLLLGIALFAGYGFQTLGLHLSTPAKTGFITGLGVVIVPLGAALLLHQMPGRMAWLGVGLATAGLGFLSWQPGIGIGPGDALVFLCALSFAAHIFLTARFAQRLDPLWLTLGQILTVVLLSAVAGLAAETRPALAPGVVFAAAFTGLLATSAAFGVQTVAQRFTSATHTALIFTAEPVFAALFSFLLIHEALGPRQLAGCALILAGMLAAELKRKE